MNQSNFNKQNNLFELISVYEAMSQKGTVAFFEEKAFLNLIAHYKNSHNISQAQKVIQDGLTQYPYSTNLYLCKAQLLVDLNQATSALDCLDKALALAPSDENILRLRQEILSSIENVSNFETNNLSFIQKSPKSMFINPSKFNEQYEDVAELYNRLKNKLRRNPTHELALNKILFCVEMTQQYEDSVAFHLELINYVPYSHLAWYNLGQAYFCLKQYENAADAYEYAFIIRENFLPAYKEFTKACFQLNDYDRPLNAYEDLLKKIEPSSDILVAVGKCYEMKEDYNIALLFFTKATKIDPLCAQGHYRIGESFTKQHKWRKAIKAYLKAIDLDNRKEEYYAALGDAYFQINNTKKASKCFEKAIDIAPDIPSYWIQFVTLLMETNQLALAWEKLEEAELYVINAPEIEYAKVACLYLQNNKNEAKVLLMEVLNQHYKQHELLFEYAPEIEAELNIIALINICNQN